MLFGAPMWLLLLVIVPVLAMLDWRRGGPRRAAIALLRASCVTAAILALAQPLVALHIAPVASIVVVDLSVKPSEATLSRVLRDCAEATSLVAFGNRAEVVTEPSWLKSPNALAKLRHRVARPRWSDDLPESGANLADALRLAGTLIPPDGRGHVQLIATGRCDHGDAAAEAWRLAQRGVSVTVQPLDPRPDPGFRIKSIAVPASARRGQTVRADIEVESTSTGTATVQLTANHGCPVTVSAKLTPGINRLAALLPLQTAGFTPIRAVVFAGDASPQPDGLIWAATSVAPAADVLLVQDASSAADLSATLSALLGSSATLHSVTADALTDQDITAADAILLADVPADHISTATQQKLINAVADGEGLLITGAAKSFGPGGYDDSALAPLLPVKTPGQMETIDPSVTLVLIIDTSGSMTGTRIDLAKEVARLAISHLKPHDKVGIVEFYGGKRWAAPIQSAGNISVIHRAIDRLTAGGGTTLYPAVEEAAFALRNVHTRSKHVLICSDGFVEDAPFESLVRQMAEDGTVVSTVQVAAPDGEANQMPDIARWGNGRYYTVLDQYALPDISFKQPQTALISQVARTPSAVTAGDDPLLAGATGGDYGNVSGYVRTLARPTADVLLKTAEGNPLLARWRHGAGFVATMPTQLGSVMSQGLQDKPLFARLFSDLLRQIGSTRCAPLHLNIHARPAGIEADITASNTNLAAEASGLQLTLKDEQGKTVRTASVQAIGPGHWNVLFPDVLSGAYTVAASTIAGASGEGGVAIPPPAVAFAADRGMLDQISSFGPLADERARELPLTDLSYVDTRPWLLWLASVFLLSHVAVRRWPRFPAIARQSSAAASVQATMPAAIAVGLLFAVMVASPLSHAATTSPTTLPSSQPLSWDQRIDESLATTGSVDELAAVLASAPTDQPGVGAAKVRAAIEQGNLNAALADQKQLFEQNPSDEMQLRRLAYLQELAGQPESARQILKTDPSIDAMLRLATLDLDANDDADAKELLLRSARSNPTAAQQAGIAAYLCGQYATAADCLTLGMKDASVENQFALKVLEGNADLKAGRNDAAQSAFAQAVDYAKKPPDRLYAQEREIASARKAGKLPQLADAWLAEKSLPSERVLPLATVLRELGRTSQLLDWWKAATLDPSRANDVLSVQVVNEIVDAARSAGRSEDTIAVCRELLALHPEDWQWLSATAQGLVSARRPAEADALLDARVDCAADAPDDLQQLGRISQAIGRDEPTIRVARALMKLGGGSKIDGALLEASVRERDGDTAAVRGLLREASTVAIAHPAEVAQVVGRLESAGMDDEAIALLKQSIRPEPSEDLLARLASLLLKDHHPADAIPILRQLADSGSSEAVRDQAAQRLLDATEATGGLKNLIDELHSRSGSDTEQHLSLLVSADLRAGDPTDAANALQNTKLLDEPTRLGRLAVLDLRTKNYEHAAEVLRQLVTASPANAEETLERLADTNIKRGKKTEAASVIDEIAHRIGDGPASQEIMAAVLDRLGRATEAAAHYRRAIALNPLNADNWLLWCTAMTKAGRAAPAMHRLQVLCGETADDNVFATAVDGLLNASSTAPVLQVARRDAVLRIARHPRSLILYQVLADLCDELNDEDAQMRAIEAGLPASDEERSDRLRALMDAACNHNDVGTAIDCGRSLLALGDDFPPQLFLELGEQLLIAGREIEASDAFARAAENADPPSMAMRVSALYRQYGYSQAALDVLAPLAERDRRDADYLETVGGLNETLGRYSDAFDRYMAAMSLVASGFAGDRSEPSIPLANGSVSSAIQKFDHLEAGAIATARTAKEQTALLDALDADLKTCLDEPTDRSAPPEGAIALANAVRRAAFAFSLPSIADTADAAVLARWPKAEAFKQQAFRYRVYNGFISNANAFAISHGIELNPAPSATMQRVETTGTTSPSLITPQSAAKVLPGMIAGGQTDAAKALLERVQFIPDKEPGVLNGHSEAPPLLTIIRAAVALNDPERAARWALFWMDPSREGKSDDLSVQPAASTRPVGDATAGYHILSLVLPLLDAKGQSQAVELFARQVDGMVDVPNRPLNHQYLAWVVLRLASALPASPPGTAREFEPALGPLKASGFDAVGNAMRVVIATPASERATALKQALPRVPVNGRLSFLTAIVAATPATQDDAMSAALITAARQLSPSQAMGWNDWFFNPAQKPLLLALADAAASKGSASTTINLQTNLTMAAAGFAVGGDQGRADATAAIAIDAIRFPPMSTEATNSFWAGPGGYMPPDRAGLVRIVVHSMSEDAREKMLLAMNDNAAPGGWTHLVRSVLLDAMGRRDQALIELRAAHQADPTDAAVNRVYLERLYDDGRWAEIVNQFTRQASGADTAAYQTRGVVILSLQNLYRWRESRGLPADSDATPETSVDVAAAAAANDTVGLAESLRLRLQMQRVPHRSPYTPAFPDRGGMARSVPAAGSDALAGAGDAEVFDRLVKMQDTRRDLLESLRIIGETNARGMSNPAAWAPALLAHAASEPGVFREIVEALGPAAAAHALTPAQRELIARLALEKGAECPTAWIDELRPAALADESGVELNRVGRALAARGLPGSSGALSWANVLMTGSGRDLSAEGIHRLPAPMDSIANDRLLAEELTSLMDRDPIAGEAFSRGCFENDRVGLRFPNAAAVWARGAAERGDLSTFRSRLEQLLSVWEWQRIVPRYGIITAASVNRDLRLSASLPTHVSDGDRHRALMDVVAPLLKSMSSRCPWDTDVTRQLALLGRWADEHGDRDAAERLFTEALALALQQGAGEHQLWVADLATELHHEEIALELQRELLRQRCLPGDRILPVLTAMRASGQTDEAHRLSVDAMIYCREPNLVKSADDGPSPR